jgi:hypothetical protein
MPLIRERFIHCQTPGKKFNGFSVYFWPHETDPTCVSYSVAMCSKHDHFCKAKAREVCFNAAEQVCRIVDFPSVLSNLDYGIGGLQSNYMRQLFANKYTWVWKYFL